MAAARSGWPIVNPVSGSKKWRRLASIATSSACPGRMRERADTRAVRSDLPRASPDIPDSSSPSAAAWLMLACATGEASAVKIAWISVPSSSVTPTRMPMRGQEASARVASSKSDGRMPRMTLLPR